MSVLIAIAAVTLMAGDAPTSNMADTANAPEESEDAMSAGRDAESMAEAEAFLAEVDARDWEGSWEVAGDFFQSQSSVAEWAGIIDPVRSPLGTVEARSIATVQRASTLPGAPEGEYEVLQFDTRFEGRAEPAIETLIMLQGSDGWQVTGYFIR